MRGRNNLIFWETGSHCDLECRCHINELPSHERKEIGRIKCLLCRDIGTLLLTQPRMNDHSVTNALFVTFPSSWCAQLYFHCPGDGISKWVTGG